MVDVDPPKLNPTERNRTVGEDIIAKRLYRFLVGKDLASSMFQLRQWVDDGGELDHNPIVLDLKGDIRKCPSSFKFNVGWLKDSNFIALVNSNWNHLDVSNGNMASIQLMENLKEVKKAMISWAHEKRVNDEE